MKDILDGKKLERIFVSGYPDALEAGRAEKAWRDSNASNLRAKSKTIGAKIMRIIGLNK